MDTIFTKVKTIFVDFDDTLCLHRYQNPVDQLMFADLPTAAQHFYGNCELNHGLVKCLMRLQQQGCRLILLSVSNSKMLDIKKYWLQQMCPQLKFDDFIAASLDATKAEIMLGYATYHHLPKTALLLIDDKSKERWNTEASSIPQISPQLVINHLDNFTETNL